MAHPKTGDPMDREFVPMPGVAFESFDYTKRGSTPKKKLDQGQTEKEEPNKNSNYHLTTTEFMGKREKGTAKKDPIDGEGTPFKPVPVPVDFDYNQLTGSTLNSAKK